MGSMRYFTFRDPSLIFSNIQAWEGAVALSSHLDDEFVASNRFFPYVASGKYSVELPYVLEFFRSDQGLRAMRRASPGTQVRNKTLSQKSLSETLIPLPSTQDQERITAHLNQLSGVVSWGSSEALQAVDVTVVSWLDDWPLGRLRDMTEISPRRQSPDSQEICFVPMAAVDGATGAITDPEVRSRTELKSGYRRFEDGDIIFARITPCMQNGKTAIYRNAAGLTGYGSTEFHVLRPRDARFTDWIWYALRSSWFIERAKASFKGTAGQQRVPADFLREVSIPLPPLEELDMAVQRMATLKNLVNSIDTNQRQRDTLAAAVLPAARNEIFNSMR